MVNLRVRRVGAGIQVPPPNLRVRRVGGAVVGAPPSLRVRRVGGAVSGKAPTLRVRRIGGALAQSTLTASVTATSTAPTAFAAFPLQSFTLTATPTIPGGDTVASWSWVPANSDSPAVDSPATASTKVRVPASMTAKTLAWAVTVTTTAGLTASVTVTVSAAACPTFTIDLTGVQHSWVLLGSSPVLYAPFVAPPGPGSPANLRVRRIGGAVQEPPAVVVTPAVLVGARFTYPGTGTVSQDFARGEAEYGGPTQISKDYASGTSLPRTYTSPYPSTVRIILSMSSSLPHDGSDPNFATYINSLPTGTILTWQHEPERPQFGWTGATYVGYLNQFRAAVRSVRTDIPVWLISGAYGYRPGGVATDGAYFAGLQADGYGLDVYRTAQANTKAADPLNTPLAPSNQAPIQSRAEFTTWRSFIPTGFPYGISEFGDGWSTPQYDPANPTVSGTIYQATVQPRRITNTQSSFTWLQANGGLFLLMWISDGAAGGVPGPQSYKPTDANFKTFWAGLPRAAPGSNPLMP
jgi:hypothetical protein